MKPFNQASHRAQVLRLRNLAENALAQYDLDVKGFSTLLHLENTTFRIEAGEQYVLRVSRAGLRTKEQIRSEAMWLKAICEDTDLIVPEPIHNSKGSLTTVASARGVPEERVCVLFTWVEGQFYRERLSPVALERIGRATAVLHEHAQTFQPPPGFARNDVEFGGDEGPGEMVRINNKGLEDGAALIAPHDLATFTLARHYLQAAIEDIGRSADVFGLIPADLHHGNCLFHDREVRIIDFDDCGWGHFHYDLAVTQWYLQAHADYDALCAAHLDGYRAIRRLTDDQEQLIPLFSAARTLLMAHYMAGRGDNPQLRDRAPRFVAHCAAVLREFLARRRVVH